MSQDAFGSGNEILLTIIQRLTNKWSAVVQAKIRYLDRCESELK